MRWGLEPFKNLSLMVLQEFLSRKFEENFAAHMVFTGGAITRGRAA